VSTFRFRLLGEERALGEWLSRVFPDLDRASRRSWIEEERVRVDGRVWDRPTRVCPAGALVEVEAAEDAQVWRFDSAERSSSHWDVLVQATPWESGEVSVAPEGVLDFDVLERRAGLARLRLAGSVCDVRGLCAGLARLGLLVVGDLVHGGLGVSGGPRVIPVPRAESAGASSAVALEWPDGPHWRWSHADPGGPVEATVEATPGRLSISDETVRAIGGGHPWVRPDRASEPAQRYRPGALVRLVDRGDEAVGWAHVEGGERLAARVWAHGDLPLRAVESVEARVARALSRRGALLVDAETDAYRLIHGEGDGLPGLHVDRLGSLLRVLVMGWASEGFRDRVLDALSSQLPVTPEGNPWNVLEVLHLRTPASAAGGLDRVRWRAGGVDSLEAIVSAGREGCMRVRERGLVYEVDPGWHAPRRPRPGFGLFLDQRDNRARVAERAGEEGGRWLNLFAHTGAFSVALLAAGAEEVVSVDLSAAWLERLEANLALNTSRGVDPGRHRSVRSDARRALEALESDKPFRGIVIDPPTAAAAGRRFWSVREDLEPVLRSAIGRLEPGGSLLVTQNRGGPPLGVDLVLERVARRAHREIQSLEPAPPGFDHPTRAGFPEGDAFEGWLARFR